MCHRCGVYRKDSQNKGYTNHDKLVTWSAIYSQWVKTGGRWEKILMKYHQHRRTWCQLGRTIIKLQLQIYVCSEREVSTDPDGEPGDNKLLRSKSKNSYQGSVPFHLWPHPLIPPPLFGVFTFRCVSWFLSRKRGDVFVLNRPWNKDFHSSNEGLWEISQNAFWICGYSDQMQIFSHQ